MNVLALCAGVGGLEAGLALGTGGSARTVCYVEREAFSATVLVTQIEAGALPVAPIWSDLETFDGRPWRGVVDCVSGGYPCQPFSAAGKRKGTSDARHLWPHFRRIIEETRPAVAFFENVPGHVKRGLSEVWGDLRGLGFEVAAGLFSAQEVGADHIRERLFILAANPYRDALRILAERGEGEARSAIEGNAESGYASKNGPAGRIAPGVYRQRGEAGGEPASGGVGGEPADAEHIGCEGVSSARIHDHGQRKLNANGLGVEYRGFKGDPWSDWPLPKPSIFKLAHGLAGELDLCVRAMRNDRLWAIGNGVVPPTAALAWETLSKDLAVQIARGRDGNAK